MNFREPWVGLLVVALLCWLPGGAAAGHDENAPPGDGFSVVLKPRAGLTGKPGVTVEVISQEGEGSRIRREIASAAGSAFFRPQGPPPWRVHVQAPRVWSLPTLVEEATGQSVEIDLYPSRRLEARISLPGDGELPESATVRLQPATPGSGRFETVTLVCPVGEDGELDCVVPALSGLDIRVRVPGFASRFFWDADLTAGAVETPHSLGTLRLVPGGSVVGTVEVPRGVEMEGVTVRLEPAPGSPMDAGAPGTADRLRSVEAKPADRGSFSLEGLEEGLYRLVVMHPDLVAPDVEPLKVLAGAQTELRDPVVLKPPRPLKVVVDPPFDPYQRDWTVRVLRVRSTGLGSRSVSAQGTTAAGMFPAQGLAAGVHEVEISDSTGMSVARQRVEDLSHDLVLVKVVPILVEGSLELGGEPLVARLTFRGPAHPTTGTSSTKVLESDAEGRFSGYLSESGLWDVRVEAPVPPVHWRSARVEIEAQEGLAELELDLPENHLEGTVVLESGEPVRGAEVTIADPLAVTRPVQVQSDLEGRFVVYGLEEGDYRVGASARRGDELLTGHSAVLRVEDGMSPDVDVVLKPRRVLSGRIVNPEGVPVPDAWIEVEPYVQGQPDPMNGGVHKVAADGSFEVPLPAATSHVHLRVMARGFALRTLRLPMGAVGEIPVSRSAGTVVIGLPPHPVPWGDPGAFRPFLVNAAGDKIYLVPLLQWSQANGMPFVDLATGPERLEIPLLPPGVYSVCWLDSRDYFDPTVRGTGCSTGELLEDGVLTLQLAPSPTN